LPTHSAVDGPLPNVGSRGCTGKGGCGESKPDEEFGWRRDRPERRCRDCRRRQNAEHVRTYRSNNPDSIRRANLWRLYRMRPEEYDRHREVQGYRCGGCGIHEDDIDVSKVGGRRRADGERAQVFALQVDHCHATGRVRGLLCPPCNRIIGLAVESVAVLRGCADYVAEFIERNAD
jgi:hypothetical protein